MDRPKLDNELTSDDLLGYQLSDLECVGCSGGICGLKTPRIIDGEVVMICPKTEAGMAVLRGSRTSSQPPR